MNDIAPSTPDRLLEALRQRERLLETELAALHARLDEVRDTLALITSRPRGRPKAARPVAMPEYQQPEPPEPEAA